MIVENIGEFRRDSTVFPPFEGYLVVKSQDQIERRWRLIEAVKMGRIGRIEDRPVADGLVVRAVISSGQQINRQTAISIATYREPRGLVLTADGGMLVSEIDRIVGTNVCGRRNCEYR